MRRGPDFLYKANSKIHRVWEYIKAEPRRNSEVAEHCSLPSNEASDYLCRLVKQGYAIKSSGMYEGIGNRKTLPELSIKLVGWGRIKPTVN